LRNHPIEVLLLREWHIDLDQHVHFQVLFHHPLVSTHQILLVLRLTILII
jgi:hypothetical protein